MTPRVMHFEQSCTLCQACTQVCPATMLSIINGQFVINNTKTCIGCKLCESVCGSDALLIQDAEQADNLFLVNHTLCQKCDTTCSICVNACATNALTKNPSGGLRFNPNLCTECGQCAEMCPGFTFNDRKYSLLTSSVANVNPNVSVLRLITACKDLKTKFGHVISDVQEVTSVINSYAAMVS